MYIKKDYGFEDLKNNSWSGAIDTLNKIEECGKEEEFMEYLESVMAEDEYKVPTETEVNDFLWFDSEMIYEALEIEEE